MSVCVASTDPFGERARGLQRLRLRLLGGAFDFESAEPRLLHLVRWAYAGLPPHRFEGASPAFRIRLQLAEAAESRAPRPLSGAGLLGAARVWSDTVLLSPRGRAALIVVSRSSLEAPYLVRYELIEFAVCTLAARSQGLVALHGACVGLSGRGVLLAGPSGSGKSTATWHALQDGFDALSEDSVFVAPRSLQATGVANFLHLRTDATAVASSPVIRRRSGVEKYEIDLRTGGYRLARRPQRLAAVALMSPRRVVRGPLLRRLEVQEALRRLRRCQPYAVAQPNWSVFERRLARIPAFELRRGPSPEDAARALREALQ